MKQRFTTKGQTGVMIAVALPTLVGALALTIDVANIYFNWMSMQKAGDAAVLAGTAYLPAYPAVAKATAINYANRNAVLTSEVQNVSVSNDGLRLSMGLTRAVPYYFLRVFGSTSTNVQTLSTASAVSVGKAEGVIPLGIDYRTQYTFGQTVQLKAGQVGAGNWEPLALGGTGSANYVSNIENGYQGMVTVGDMIQTEPGNVVGPTGTAITYLMSQGNMLFPSGTFSVHELDDPRVLLVPMVDFSGINGRSEVPVKGFAELWVVSLIGNNNTITTYFIEQTSPNTRNIPGVDSFGAFTPVLVQ